MMASTYTPIATYTVTGSAAASYTFSSIPTTYTDLVLVGTGYGNGADGNSMLFQVGNGSVDTGSNYSFTSLRGDGTSALGGRTTGSSFGQMQITGGLSNSSSYPANFILHFMNYSNTTTYKTILLRSNATLGTYASTEAVVNLWRSTSAINTIKVYPYSGESFEVGFTWTLYGILAA